MRFHTELPLIQEVHIIHKRTAHPLSPKRCNITRKETDTPRAALKCKNNNEVGHKHRRGNHCLPGVFQFQTLSRHLTECISRQLRANPQSEEERKSSSFERGGVFSHHLAAAGKVKHANGAVGGADDATLVHVDRAHSIVVTLYF